MTNKDTNENILLTTIPFQGFYDSWHSDQIDYALETHFDYNGDGVPDIDIDDLWYDVDINGIKQKYVSDYVDYINQELDISSLELKSLYSPKEYNFTTDRIFCYISYKDIRKMYSKVYKDYLPEVIKEQFTSYDGFTSYYSNDLDDWIEEKPMKDWDCNQIGAIVEAYARFIDVDMLGEFFDYTKTHEWIGEYIPEKYHDAMIKEIANQDNKLSL
jgi:hypothetical protein